MDRPESAALHATGLSDSQSATSRKRSASLEFQAQQHLVDAPGTGLKRPKNESPTVEKQTAHREVRELSVDSGQDVPTQTYADLPLTEAAQAAMTREIEDHERFILFAQQILRILINENPEFLQSNPAFLRDVQFILQSPTIVDVMISVVGPTGVGKSTLIAALFGMKDITQSSELGKAVTTTIIVFGENKDESCECKAIFQFITKDQFKDTIGNVYESLVDNQTLEEAENYSLDMVVAFCGQSVAQLTAMLPKQAHSREPNDVDRNIFIEEVLSHGQQKLLGQKLEFPYQKWQGMRDDVQQKVSASEQNRAAWWPILSTVQLLIKHPLVKRGLKLTDTPGTGDSNAARAHIALSAITQCNATVLTVPAVRANSVKTHRNEIKRTVARVHQDGRLHTIIIACTQADQMDVEQTARNLKSDGLAVLSAEFESASDRLKILELQVPEEQAEYAEKKRLIEDCNRDIKRWNRQLKNAQDGKRLTIPRAPVVKVEFSRPLNQDGIHSALSQLQNIQEEHDKRCKVLSKKMPDDRNELKHLRSEVLRLDHDFNRHTFEARNKHIANEQVEQIIKFVEECEKHSVAALKQITQRDVTSNLEDVKYWNKLRKQFYPSMVAAKAHLDLLANKGGATGVVKSLEMTGVDELALRLKGVNLVEQLAHVTSLRTKVDLILNTLRDATSDRAMAPTLAEAALTSQSMLLKELNRLPQLFNGIVDTAKVAIDTGFKMEYIDREKKLVKHTLGRATQRMKLFAAAPSIKLDKTRDKGMYAAELRAACAATRRGIWDGKSIFVDFNDTVAAPIRMYTSTPLRNIFTTATDNPGSQMAHAALYRCEKDLIDIIDMRHREFLRLGGQVQMNSQTLHYLREQVRLRKCDVVNMVRQARNDMAEVHVRANRDITNDVRVAYTAAYQRAYVCAQSGPGSKERATHELEQALTTDNIVRGAMQMLKQRIQQNYGTVMTTLMQQINNAAESMRQDYSQTLQKQEDGFIKIVSRKFATALESGLLALENFGVDEDERVTTDDEENEGGPLKIEYAEREDPLDYA